MFSFANLIVITYLQNRWAFNFNKVKGKKRSKETEKPLKTLVGADILPQPVKEICRVVCRSRRVVCLLFKLLVFVGMSLSERLWMKLRQRLGTDCNSTQWSTLSVDISDMFGAGRFSLQKYVP